MNKEKKYIVNPITNRPIIMYGKQHINLIKINIFKDKLIKPTVLTFKNDVNDDVIELAKNAISQKDGMFITRFKNKIIQKNRKLTIEEMIEFIIDNYPNILNDSLNEINDADTDEDIKLKFSKIIHKKLMS